MPPPWTQSQLTDQLTPPPKILSVMVRNFLDTMYYWIGVFTNAFPIGTVLPWFYGAIPSGWTPSVGDPLLKTEWPLLWNLYNDGGNGAYGGDGAATFNTRDCQAVGMRGIGTQTISGRVKTGPADVQSVLEDQGQGHFHRRNSAAAGEVIIVGSGAFTFSAGASGLINVTNTAQEISNGADGTPRTGTETRGNDAGVIWIVRGA